MSKKFLACLVLILASLCLSKVSFAQTKRKNPPKQIAALPNKAQAEISAAKLTPEQQRRVQTFQIVWQTIKDNYFDQTFNNLDWDAVRKEYEPRVVASQTDAQLHFLLQEMINRLNRSHFTIIPPEVYQEIAKAKEKAKSENLKQKENNPSENAGETADTESDDEDFSAEYGIGVEVRILDNRVVITNVEKNSAAAKANLKAGFVIEKVNNVSLRDLLEKIQNFAAYSKAVQKQLPLEIVVWFLNGEKDTSVNLNYSDEKDELKTIDIKREKLEGESVKILQNLPEQFLSFKAESLNAEIGYIKFNFFAASVIDKFCGAISQFKDKKALVIDLRGNLGGSIGVMLSLGGLLTDKELRLGTAIYKVGKEDLLISPHIKNFKGKIVVLTDGLSYSAAEIFAAALQENSRAIVVGDRSAGEALPAATKILPTGAVFLFPIANFQTPNGNLLEGKGVEPDTLVSLDRQSLLEGGDKQLDAAVNFLRENLSKKDVATNNQDKISVKSENPPPPKPMPKIIANVNVPLPPAKITAKKGQDAAALKIIADFIMAAGGETALKSVNSYTAKGAASMTKAGANVSGSIEIYRKAPNKYTEELFIDGVGRLREIFDGKSYFVDSEILGTQKFSGASVIADKNLFADFYEILKIRELYPTVSFLGKFDSAGRKVNLIEALTPDGDKIAFAFDAETKLLVHRSSSFTDVSFADYRKVGSIQFPFRQTRSPLVAIQLDEVKINEKIDESVFSAHESCFDKPD